MSGTDRVSGDFFFLLQLLLGSVTDLRASPYRIWAMALLSAKRPNIAVDCSRSAHYQQCQSSNSDFVFPHHHRRNAFR